MPYTPKLTVKVIVGYCFIQTCLNIIYATFPTMRLLSLLFLALIAAASGASICAATDPCVGLRCDTDPCP